MNHDWNPSPDPLVVDSLPIGRNSPDWCELCERINELPRRWATYETIRYVLISSLIASLIGFVPRYANGTEFADMPIFWLLVFAIKLGFCVVLYLLGTPRLRVWLHMTAAWIFFGGLLWFQAEAAEPPRSYLILFPIAVGCSVWLAFLVSTQFVFYTAANLDNEWYVADAWRSYWVAFIAGRPAKHRLEFPSMLLTIASLAIAIGVGVVVNEQVGFGEFGFLIALFVITPSIWPKRSDLVDCLASSWRAWEVFLTYERKPCNAPGVFRFPTRWLRPHLRRILAVLLPHLLVALSVGTTLPAKWPQRPNYTFVQRPAMAPDTQVRPSMTRIELDHYDRIAFRGEQDAYLSLIRRRRAQEEASYLTDQKKFARKAVTTAIGCVLIPPTVVFGTLVFLFGPVLAAYRRNLDGTSP